MRRNAMMPVEALLDPPPGTERAGDEFHDPQHWVTCQSCGVDCPERSDRCYYCHEPLP